MFTLLAEAAVGKHFYWNLAGFLVHGQVLVVIWFVVVLLLIFSFLGTSNADRIPHGWQNFMEASVEFVTDIAKDQLGESFYKEWIPFIGTLFFFIFGCNWAGAIIPWKLIELPEGEFAAPTNDINTTVALALLTFSFLGTREADRIPHSWQNFMESALDFIVDIARNQLGESFYREWIPFIGTLFLFIFGCNWAGAVIPWKLIELPEGEFAAPTNDINTTVALALLTSFAYFYAGLSKKGLGYFKRYINPIPLLLPINILEDFTKPLSLSFRLFGNVLADELTITVLTSLVPLVVPLPIMLLGIFAGSVQALIFSTLAAAYIAEALE